MEEKCVLDPSRDCLGLAKARMLEKLVEEHREKSSKDHHEMYDRIRQLEIANAKTDTQYGQIMETLGTLKAEISALKEKPARRWEIVITAIITGVVSIVLGLIFAGV